MPIIETIMKEFEEQFKYLYGNKFAYDTDYLKVQSFLKSALTRIREATLDEVIEEAEGMKKTKIRRSGPNDKMWVKLRIATITKKQIGANDILSRLITSLKQKK